MPTILLQADAALSGGAGWVGAGLLGLVLSWLLLKHLPAKDAQLKELIDKKDTQMSGLLAQHLAAEKDQRVDFRQSLERVVDQHTLQMTGFGTAISADIKALREAIETIRHLMERVDEKQDQQLDEKKA